MMRLLGESGPIYRRGGLNFDRRRSAYNPAAEFAKVTASPAFVWSTVKLVEAYNGPAIRVLRPSDSAEVDIGFTGYRLNETALYAHLGAEIGQIVRYYDQSGNANHSDAQTTAANRATIGPNVRINGNLVTLHTASIYNIPATLTFDRRNSSFYTASGGRVNSGGAFGLWRIGNAGDPYFLVQGGRAIQGASNHIYAPLGRYVSEFYLSGSTGIRALNELQDDSAGPFSAGTETGGQAGTADSGYTLQGDHDAFIGYTSALSVANREAIKAALSYAWGGILTTQNRVIFVGDSITGGTGDSRYGGYSGRAALTLPVNCYANAQGGAQLTSFVSGYSSSLTKSIIVGLRGQPSVVFLHMGTNDLTIGGRTAAQIYADIQAYAGFVRADGAKIVVSTILPNAGWNGTQQTTRNDLNTLIRNGWSSFADGLCDFAADPVMGPQAAASNATLYGDGLHPAPQGHANLAVLADAAIRPLLVPAEAPLSAMSIYAGSTTGFLSAINPAKMWQDAARSIPVTAVGDPVGAIELPMRNGVTYATQGTGTARPVYRLDGSNKPFLDMSGSKWMTTAPIDGSAFDKSQMFAAYRANNTGNRMVLEVSANVDINNGVSFFLIQDGTTGNRLKYLSKGTSPSDPFSPDPGVSRTVNRYAIGQGDISGDLAILREMGAETARLTLDQGTGNYGYHSVSVGHRGGSGFFLNDSLYFFGLRYGPNLSAAEIAQMEAYMAGLI